MNGNDRWCVHPDLLTCAWPRLMQLERGQSMRRRGLLALTCGMRPLPVSSSVVSSMHAYTEDSTFTHAQHSFGREVTMVIGIFSAVALLPAQLYDVCCSCHENNNCSAHPCGLRIIFWGNVLTIHCVLHGRKTKHLISIVSSTPTYKMPYSLDN